MTDDNGRNSILIVANGSSVLRRELGLEIDRFDTVGRINNYATTGFERYVGSRTDIWFNGANQQLRRPDVIPERVVVLIPEDVLRRKGEQIHDRIGKRVGVEKDRYELVPRAEILEYEKEIGASRPTTGTSAIMWAIRRFEAVSIHGFDFFIDSATHYHDGRVARWLVEKRIVRRAGKHDMEKEKAFVERLVSEGRVRRLTDQLG